MLQRLKRQLPIILVTVLAVGVAIAMMSQDPSTLHARGEDEPPASDSSIVTPLPMELGAGNPYLIADVAERVTPAVVYVEARWPVRENPRNPFADDPFFRDFFPFNPWPDARPQVQRGTGFIVDESGYILTNQHVVGHANGEQTVVVKIHTPGFHGEVPAELLGSDERLDLAVLKIDPPKELERLPTVPLGDSDASRPGEWVIAVGNPYGEQFEHTVTVGVLSAKGREIQIYDSNARSWKNYRNLMQTDAAINPGNSGGPLINIRGEVIGINTAVSASAQGIGFAIPINTAIRVKEQLIHDGHVKRAFLGVGYDDLTQREADILGLEDTAGALVLSVVEGSAAEAAGIQRHDVIKQIGDVDILEGADLQAALDDYAPGDEIAIHVWRDGRLHALTALLTERPEDQ